MGHNPTTLMSVCRPTEMGGLAFRDLEKLNLALLTKFAWRICSESETLMARTLSSKYCKHGDLLHQDITTKNCSYVWNGISKGLNVVQQNYFMEINNGRKTKIWRDRWIPGMLHPPSPQNDHYRFYKTVEELMVSETPQCNSQLITFLFDGDTALKIQALFIDTNKEDNMIWMPAKYGVFSVKITYKMLSYNDSDVQVDGRTIERKVWKTLWKCKAAQRIELFALKCIRGLHSSKYKRAIYNNSLEVHCDICGHSVETIKHILFECRHARKVWRGININIDTIRVNYGSVSEWVTSCFSQYFQSKDDHWLYTLMIGAWIIWKDRCDVVFQGVTLNHITSIRKIHYHIASHMHDSYTVVIPNSTISRWKPPLESILKYNTDGSFDSDSNQFGTGVVLCNSTGHCIGTKGTYVNGALSPEVVECMAIREALL
ncbi:uncharacterized protein LOC113360022 [Papaver somniferum]|uniref:uncharacterized protein LOC113360022 n=1 Tax=Papaver somniferum TaxID=3469 RepID=UPI000E704BB4|nr:uncharacterized protein LOC113360022 [Papaver somniferum]